MKVFSLGVHVATALVMAANGLLLLFVGLMGAIAAGLFDGNAIGIIMVAAALAVIAGAVYTLRTGFADASLLQTDQALYKAQELRLTLIALAFAAAATLVLFIFSAFSISNVFEYGFGWVLYMMGAAALLNIVSCVWVHATVG